MKEEWFRIAGELLDKAADEFSNHGCNDWDFPPFWTEGQKEELIRAMQGDNGSLDEWEREDCPIHSPPDWWVMRFLSKQLIDLEDS